MFRGASAGNYRYPSRLGSGINVSIGNFVANRPGFFATLASGGAYGNFRAPGEGFVGIKFNSGAGVQYGWVRLNMNGSDQTSMRSRSTTRRWFTIRVRRSSG